MIPMAITGKNRIMIFGPKSDGTYVVEFNLACRVSSKPRSSDRVLGRDLLRYGFAIASPRNDAIPDDSRDGHLPCEE